MTATRTVDAPVSGPAGGPAERDADPFGRDESERRGRRRNVLAWVALGAVVLLLGGLLSLFVARDWTPRPPLDPEGPGADGARAIVQILREQGVEVVPTMRRADTLERLDASTTLVLTDPWTLSEETIQDLVAAAGDTVVLDADGAVADLLVPGASYAGYGDEPIAPACALPVAERAGAIAPGRALTAPAGAEGCYPVGEGFGLVRAPGGAGHVTLIDGTVLFTNEHLAQEGNAALGLGLIGTHERVVWYVPSFEDAEDGGAAPTLGDLTPPWVTPAIVLLLLAGLAAALWRGRRFGPLVAERLPVTVRGSETLEGRARLYARAAEPAHAAALLREGAAARMARRLGLPPNAAPLEVADAAAVRLGAPSDVTRAILTHVPTSDADLAALGRRLRDLEDAVDAARTDGRAG
ncbi:DUF4350 domain-containing protein [Microbacterium sp. JZ31]|uniref:DUF4350 domain-containing protein n=1 Tax=Microbacterium sp. JZ31 TaxID=1906274 RepID=UPI001EE3EC31|nr:DUF4350 domain-containing protein [Microbacterium sp. JZ31]